MDKIKKNFGFGCMRFSMKDGEVDKEQMRKMVDAFLEQGFNYFDTAHGYLDGKSELALRDCLYSLSLLYCGCPKQISIPDLFACMNVKKVFNDCNANYYYSNVHTVHNGKASDCIKCGKCEKACSQHLPIRDLLEDVAKEFESAQK